MGRAVLEDCLAITNCEVYTTCDSRIQPPAHPRLTVYPISSPTKETEQFLQLATKTEQTLLIAPELDGVLEERIQQLASINRNSLLSTPEAVRVASDKSLFYETAKAANLPVPTTLQLSERDRQTAPLELPVVVKPRRGAGTTDTAIVRTQREWQKLWESELTIESFLVQAFIPGQPISLSCVIAPGHGTTSWLPAGTQCFERLTYRGGTVGQTIARQSEAESIAAAAVAAIPGLNGYIGIDLILPEDPDLPVMLLEVNSRITTSYLGYRRLVSESLAERMLGLTDKTTWTRAADYVEFAVPDDAGEISA